MKESPGTHAIIILALFTGAVVCQSSSSGDAGDNVITPDPSSGPNRPLYRVVTVEHTPWVMRKPDGGYEGFIVDLLDKVSQLSGFRYVIKPSSDQTYGAQNHFTGEWSGIVGDLVNQVAEIGAADLVISDDRARVVTFSAPIMPSGAQILIRKPDAPPAAVTFLLYPFTLQLWVLIIIVFLTLGGAFYLIDRFSPFGWRALPEERDKRWGKKSFTVRNSYMFAIRTMLLQGYRENPKSTSGRILSLCWFYFAISTVLCYGCSLTTFILANSSPKPVIPFKSFEEMSRQSDVVYGGWFGMILNPNDPLQRTLDRFISSKYTHYMNMDEAVDRVRNRDRPFAAIVNGRDGIYLSQQNCDLMLLREKLFDIRYGLACSSSIEGQALCNNISHSLVSLRESGDAIQMEKKWWRQNVQCEDVVEEDYLSGAGQAGFHFRPIGIKEMSFAFIVLLVGVFLSAAALTGEVYYRRRYPVTEAESTQKKEEGSRDDPLGSDQQDLERLADAEDPVSEQVTKYVEEP